MTSLRSAHAQIRPEDYPAYQGSDLGLTMRDQGTWQYRIWSPQAEAVEMILYANDQTIEPLRAIPLRQSTRGTWTLILDAKSELLFYTFRVRIDGKWLKESPDPYAKRWESMEEGGN